MVLTTEELQKRVENSNNIIENSIPENFQQIAYDLRIQDILLPTDEESSHKIIEKYDLPAGEVVFVSTIEDLNMPSDLIGIITQRNSIIRSGLRVEAPVYLPGHHTKLFLRITNISKNEIRLIKGDGIAAIMFEQLSGSVSDYKGDYVDEFNFKGIGNFKNDIPRAVKIDKKIEQIENIEKTLYEKVIAILTIFVGIFSLINLNVHFLNDAMTIDKMLIFNLFSIGGIGLLVSFIGFIIHDRIKRSSIILTLSIILIALAFVITII